MACRAPRTSLPSGSRSNAVGLTASGGAATGDVATGTNAFGMATSNTCFRWSADVVSGTFGDPTATGGNWTDDGSSPCFSGGRFYCFGSK